MNNENPYHSPAPLDLVPAQQGELLTRLRRCRLAVLAVLLLSVLLSLANLLSGISFIVFAWREATSPLQELREFPLFRSDSWPDLSLDYAIGGVFKLIYSVCFAVAAWSLWRHQAALLRAIRGQIGVEQVWTTQLSCWYIAGLLALAYLARGVMMILGFPFARFF